MSNLPSLVFVLGSWHKPTCYDKLISILNGRYGLKGAGVTLPSTLDNPSATFKDDRDAACNAISQQTDDGRNVVVIAHSCGGMVGNSAGKGFTRPKNATASGLTLTQTHCQSDGQETDSGHRSQGYVIGLILIASGLTLTGFSFMDPFLGRPPPSWRVNKETGYAELVTPPCELFYHDLSAEEADHHVSRLTTQSLKALFEGGEHSYAGWQDVPVWYIGTIEDRGLPVAVQRMQVGMAREMGSMVEHRELRTSHSPFLSQPEETASIVREAIEAFLGRSVQPKKPESAVATKILVPQARLWQPLSWLSIGLPVLLGRAIGRCLLLLRWIRKT